MRYIYWLIIASLFPISVSAKGAGTSAGTTLMESAAPRSAALGNSLNALPGDVLAFQYNPGALATLASNQAMFMFQRGAVDDQFSEVVYGHRLQGGGLGFSIGYYDGGNLSLFDGTTERSVKAQEDIVLGFGYGQSGLGWDWGITGKYIRSEIAELVSAQAIAVDVGSRFPLTPNLNLGLAFQNFGTKLKYRDEAENLPQITRVGMAYQTNLAHFPVTLLADAPYYNNEAEVQPSVGLEVSFGGIAFRSGYRFTRERNEFTIGSGLVIGRSMLDYSVGFADELDSEHRVSYSFSFDNPGDAPEFVKKLENSKEKDIVLVAAPSRVLDEVPPPMDGSSDVVVYEQEPKIITAQPEPEITKPKAYATPVKVARPVQIHVVMPGDTLVSLAEKFYGKPEMWRSIYRANLHLMDSPSDLFPGKKIILP